jgi:hypothetical protein
MSLAGGTGSRKITGQEIMNASKLSVNNTPVINGTAGRIFFQDATNVLQQSGNLFWDNTNAGLGIGTSTPSSELEINKNVNGVVSFLVKNTNTGSSASTGFAIGQTPNLSPFGALYFDYYGSGYTPSNQFRIANSAAMFAGVGATNGFSFAINNSNSNGVFKFWTGTTATEKLRIFNNGNVLIQNGGTFTDAGFRLDVNGTARVTELTVGSLGTNALISFGGGVNTTIFRDFGENSLNYRNVFSSTVVHRFRTNSDLPNANTSGNNVFLSLPIGFAPTSGTGTWAQLSMTPTINQTGGANGITRGLYVNPTLTAAADFRAIETTTGNVLFGTGFFWDNANGRLGVGTATPANRLELYATGSYNPLPDSNTHLSFRNAVGYQASFNLTPDGWLRFYSANGHVFYSTSNTQIHLGSGLGAYIGSFNDSLKFGTIGGTERMRLVATTGNVLIGTTTDAGFKLDVNGTARVKGTGATSATTAFTVQNSAGTAMLTVKDGGADKVVVMPSAVIGQIEISGLNIGAGGGNTVSILQPVAIGGTLAVASAQLQVDSTTRGFLPPRQTQAQRTAIASPAVGLIVYQTDGVEGLYVYKSTGWAMASLI